LSAEQKKQKWTLIELLNWTTAYLADKKIDEARLTTELLLSYSLGLSRIELYTNYDRPLTPEELASFKSVLKRRVAHEPLQYIFDECEFYSLQFKVSPHVFIPRPETEILVEQVLSVCKSAFPVDDDIQLLDIGTGSGCIAVSLAKHLPNAVITAVDNSQDALQMAYGNAQAHQVDISFDKLDALKPWPTKYVNSFDVIVSNPPYVSFAEYKKLPPEIRDFEPKESLLGGNDGLEFYRKISNILPSLLKPNAHVFFEIGERQASSVKNIFADSGFPSIQIVNDLAGKNRVVKMHWSRRSD